MYNITFNPQTPSHLQSHLSSLISQTTHNFQTLLTPISNLDFYISLATPSKHSPQQHPKISTPFTDSSQKSPFTPQNHHVIKQNSPTISATTYQSGVIFLELTTPNFPALELHSTLFHELNHHYRNQIFSTEDHPTLFNWALLEGLATTFEIFAMQHFHNSPIFNSHITNCSPKELHSGLSEILHIDQSNLPWNYYDWFYNSDLSAPYPVNFAYQIATWLVSSYCQSNHISPPVASKLPNHVFLTFAEHLCA